MPAAANMVEVAALVGDTARATMLAALMGGQALTSSELAYCAGVSRPTASEHLAKLTAARLLSVTQKRRNRYYRIASPLVARMLESIKAVAAIETPARHQPRSAQDEALRFARTCYDHLAGLLGVTIADALVARRYLSLSEDGGALTRSGTRALTKFGANLSPAAGGRRIFCRACLDWSERRYHVAGLVGAEIWRRCWSWAGCGGRAQVARLTDARRQARLSRYIRCIGRAAVPLIGQFGRPPSASFLPDIRHPVCDARRHPRKPPRAGDLALSAAAPAQSGGLVAMGTGGAGGGPAHQQADPALGRLRRLPLVPRDGARELRGRSHRRGDERAVRQHQSRSRGAARHRPDLHDRAASARRAGRLAADDVPDARRRAGVGRHVFSQESRFGRPAFTDVLREVARLFREEPDKIEQNRAALLARLAEKARPAARSPSAYGARQRGGAGRQHVRSASMAACAARRNFRKARSSNCCGGRRCAPAMRVLRDRSRIRSSA